MEQAQNYGRTLRAIGQDLERQDIQMFDIERRGDDYLVWVRSKTYSGHDSTETEFTESEADELLWEQGEEAIETEEDDDSEALSSSGPVQLIYTPGDVVRLDRTGEAYRQTPHGMANGHSMPQLLRALGSYVNQVSGRLQAVSWREESVAVVYDTPLGRRELDVFRPESIYDIWVGMYVRRSLSVA